MSAARWHDEAPTYLGEQRPHLHRVLQLLGRELQLRVLRVLRSLHAVVIVRQCRIARRRRKRGLHLWRQRRD